MRKKTSVARSLLRPEIRPTPWFTLWKRTSRNSAIKWTHTEKSRIEDAIAKVKKALEGDDIEAIKKTQDELMNVSHKLAEAMYAKTAGSQAGPGTAETSRAPINRHRARKMMMSLTPI